VIALVALIGFVIGAVGPFLLGISALQGLHEYTAEAQATGEMVCGLPAIVPLALFFVVTPVCGLIGAVVATSFAALAATRALDSTDDFPGA
jgi:hypothetical protein